MFNNVGFDRISLKMVKLDCKKRGVCKEDDKCWVCVVFCW